MGKDGGFMTAKAISKRIKAKGLGRLRWYCQMCEKQCRDENGFKCHTQSATHQRQLALFAEDSSAYITRFSNEFRREYLLVLRQRYGTGFVNANTVYQEHIKDRDHVHMNATKWTTLTAFVKELGKQGYCRVEERPDGFWVSYLDRDAADRNRKARELDKLRMEDEEQNELELRRQMEAAAELAKTTALGEQQHEPRADSAPVSIRVNAKLSNNDETKPAPENAFAKLGSEKGERDGSGAKRRKSERRGRQSRWQDAPKVSVLEEIMQKEGAKRSGTSAKPLNTSNHVPEKSEPSSEKSDEPWIRQDIIVKVTNEKLEDGAFYGKKGKIIKVIDNFGARVRMNDSDAVLELDQDDLETVIPKPGGRIVLLKGRYRGNAAIVKSINVERFSITVYLEETGDILHEIDYESASRIW